MCNYVAMSQQMFIDLYCVLKHNEGAGGVAQVVEHLCSKCEALNSNPSPIKKKKQNKYPPQNIMRNMLR
jgi:hypothetical protein